MKWLRSGFGSVASEEAWKAFGGAVLFSIGGYYLAL